MLNTITFFSCPKPFYGHDALIQTNALNNWKALGVQVILLGDDDGVAEAALEFGFHHIKCIKKTSLGTPLLSDIFSKAQEYASTDLLCYTNADMLYPQSLLQSAFVVEKQFTKFLLLGQRWDANIQQVLDFSDKKFEILTEIVKKSTQHPPFGLDYFLFPKGLIDMPEFAVGRPFWDGWMVLNANKQNIPIIDGSIFIKAVHQNHGYNHIPEKVSDSWDKSPESIENFELFKTFFQLDQAIYANVHIAKWCIDCNGSVIRNFTARRFFWFFSNSLTLLLNEINLSKRCKQLFGEKTYMFLKKTFKPNR